MRGGIGVEEDAGEEGWEGRQRGWIDGGHDVWVTICPGTTGTDLNDCDELMTFLHGAGGRVWLGAMLSATAAVVTLLLCLLDCCREIPKNARRLLLHLIHSIHYYPPALQPCAICLLFGSAQHFRSNLIRRPLDHATCCYFRTRVVLEVLDKIPTNILR